MRLPQILVIGAQKSGTTWMARYFDQHPDVFIPPGEVDYFCDPEKAAQPVEWYASQFDGASEGQILADKSPGYLYTNSPKDFTGDIPAKMHALLPEAKLLIALREPVSRLISALNHHIERLRISPDEDFDAILLGARKDEGTPYGFLERGLYARQIDSFLEYYPREQMRIFLYEDDIAARPEETIRDLTEFVGIAPQIDSSVNSRANRRMNTKFAQRLNHKLPALRPLIAAVDRMMPRAAPFRPSAACMKELYAYYAPEIDRLEELIGRDLSTWRKKAAHG
ncbi:sulfotransferase [Parvularcula marina]|uniref:sulfotransferase family protein n=1 Tax=Parvularcula marina TaxID=2292771 RepID=UPI0035155540